MIGVAADIREIADALDHHARCLLPMASKRAESLFTEAGKLRRLAGKLESIVHGGG